SVLVLCVIGTLFIYSSGVSSEGELVSSEYAKQIVWVALGLIVMIVLILADPKRLPEYSGMLYILTIGVLVYTRLFGRVVNGARSWLGIGELGIQPSEFAKITTMLFLARYLDSTRRDPAKFKRFAYSFGIVLLPMALILSQPDFGTALVFIPIYLAMALIGGIELRYLLFLLLAGGTAAVLTVLPLLQSGTSDQVPAFIRVLYEAPYPMYILLLSAVVLGLSILGFSRTKQRYYYWISYVSFMILCGVGGSILGHKVLKDYQIMRLVVFLDPSVDPLGSGWNILQSITAIGSGGFSGKGFLQGTQSHYRYLPQQSTDFIFSIISEELGFIGGILVFSLFLFILVRL
ncbi:MAG TPA: rod shape-determining protein RodA, partial [Spirochaetales bacterium]|nr:rod shape-determining protein RodA [Spirochaetales bacterium]